jgi:hypothetical protein
MRISTGGIPARAAERAAGALVSEPEEAARIDRLHAELVQAGESAPRLREVLAREEPDEEILLAVLRRVVPARLLEHLGSTAPWSERPRVLARVVLNPRAPRPLSLRLVSALFWRDLADVAAAPHLSAAVRVRAEAALKELVEDMRLGDRVTLAKLATPAILRPLLLDDDRRVIDAALINARLREEDLLNALRVQEVPLALVDAVVASSKWSQVYGVRLALVLQPRTPLPIALLQMSSLVRRDLLRVADSTGVRPLLQASARALLDRL